MRKAIIYISSIWTIIILSGFLLGYNRIYSSFLIFENVLKFLSFLYFIIVPLLLILLIKNKTIKRLLLVIDIVLLVMGSFVIMFLGIFLINDIIIGNGYRHIFERELSKNKYFSIYRTSDAGAFGGDYRVYSIDKKLPLGFVKRHFLLQDEYQFYQDVRNNTEKIIFGEDTIFVDNDLLDKKGDLK